MPTNIEVKVCLVSDYYQTNLKDVGVLFPRIEHEPIEGKKSAPLLHSPNCFTGRVLQHGIVRFYFLELGFFQE